MHKSLLLASFIVVSVGICLSQSLNDFPSQGAAFQGTTSQGPAADCSDPSLAGSAACSAAQAQRSGSNQGQNSPPMLTPELRSSEGFATDQNIFSSPALNPSQVGQPKIPLRPETEFEQMVADS